MPACGRSSPQRTRPSGNVFCGSPFSSRTLRSRPMPAQTSRSVSGSFVRASTTWKTTTVSGFQPSSTPRWPACATTLSMPGARFHVPGSAPGSDALIRYDAPGTRPRSTNTPSSPHVA